MAISPQQKFAFHLFDILCFWIRIVLLPDLVADVSAGSPRILSEPGKSARIARSFKRCGRKYRRRVLDGSLGQAVWTENRTVRSCVNSTHRKRFDSRCCCCNQQLTDCG